jgi:hypothetical protein
MVHADSYIISSKVLCLSNLGSQVEVDVKQFAAASTEETQLRAYQCCRQYAIAACKLNPKEPVHTQAVDKAGPSALLLIEQEIFRVCCQ